jgi:biopolymer transport protein ExbD
MASSKLRGATAADDIGAELDMSPMIDMVFLLLLFFLVNATAIIVRNDPSIKPPVASAGKTQEDGRGRIVINVRKDGTFRAEDYNIILPSEVEIADLVKKDKEKIVMQGITPKLHLRGDQDALFKYARTAIKAAASAGVDQVVFTVYPRKK